MTPDRLAHIHRAAFKPSGERGWSGDEFRTLQDNPHTHLTPADQGFALWRSVAGEAELLTMAVIPAAQNTGIGRQLMSDWMGRAASCASTAFLEVAADNGAALKLYGHFGFKTVARRTDYYTRHPGGHADALVMRARLPFSVH